MSGWEIEENPAQDGTYDVSQDRRIVRYDQDLDEAVSLVRQRGGTEYVLIEADGYRTTHRV